MGFVELVEGLDLGEDCARGGGGRQVQEGG